MTTNFRDRLDPALMRPGRADTHVFLNNASHSQLQRLFMKFNPEEEKLSVRFANALPEFKLSMAKMQGHFLKYRGKPQECFENIQEILNDQAAIEEMTVQEWLERLNLSKYLANF
jgi:chaperone BCS1